MKVRFLDKHTTLPSVCSICGEKNEYWVDETFGCKKGHIVAFRNVGSHIWLTVDTPIMEVEK